MNLADLETLETRGEVKNMNLDAYIYKTTADGQKFVIGDGKYCYKSALGAVVSVLTGCEL